MIANGGWVKDRLCIMTPLQDSFLEYLPPIYLHENDERSRKASLNGKSVKLACMTCKQNLPENDYLGLIWNKLVIPARDSPFSWRLVNGFLATERIQRRNIVMASKMQCGELEYSTHHIFWGCEKETECVWRYFGTMFDVEC